MPQVSPVDDRTNAALTAALNGLAARQRATARNIANVDTPGFTARRVEFEDQLRAATAFGDPRSAAPTEVDSDSPAAMNGNNVQLDDEMVSLEETGMRYQLLSEAVTARARILRAAIGR